MKKYLLPALAALFMTACATNGAENTSDAGQAQQAIAAAEAAAQKANSVGYEWRDTGKMIKKAKKEAADDNYDQAVKLADKARRQGELAYQQYLSQKTAGMN